MSHTLMAHIRHSEPVPGNFEVCVVRQEMDIDAYTSNINASIIKY